jgi:hypothetical protein
MLTSFSLHEPPCIELVFLIRSADCLALSNGFSTYFHFIPIGICVILFRFGFRFSDLRWGASEIFAGYPASILRLPSLVGKF